MRAPEITELAERSLWARGATWVRREVECGFVRADIMAGVHGELVVIEVKGHGDSGTRLEHQLPGYGRCAARVELWLADSVLPHGPRGGGRARVAEKHPWVHIVSAEGTDILAERNEPSSLDLYQIGSRSPHLSGRASLGLLWLVELRALAKALGCSRGPREKWDTTTRVLEAVGEGGAQTAVCEALARRDWGHWARLREERMERSRRRESQRRAELSGKIQERRGEET